jgi:hypothetical protein
MTYNAREDAFYLYGGGIDRDHFTDEFWVYSPKLNSWHQIPKPQ